MKQKIGTFGILCIGLILFTPMVLAGAGDINVPPDVELVSEEELNKIEQYVIDYSGIYEYYFTSHYDILNAYKISFSSEDGLYCREIDFPYEDLTLEECKDYFAVYVLWKFNVGAYSDVIVGSQYAAPEAGIYVEEPGRFIFIFKNNEIVDTRASKLSSNPIPKFREIVDMISPDQLNSWIEECGEFTRPYGLKLTPKSSDSDTLSFVYYGWGKRDGKNVEFFADLETGENYCNEIMLVGGQKTGVIPSTNYTNLILIIAGVIVVLAAVIILYKKSKK